MINPNISYKIISTTDMPDGNKQVDIEVSKTEVIGANPTEDSNTMISTTISFTKTLVVLPTEVVVDKINEFLETNPI